MIRLGFLGGIESGHALSYARAAQQGLVPGVTLAAFWAEDADAAGRFAAEHGFSTVVDTPERMLEERLIDAVLVLQRDPNEHRVLAIPFLEAAIPTYVDKPLAATMSDARAIAAAAERNATPLLSCSALRFNAEVRALGSPSHCELRTVVATGYRETVYYGIHAAEAVYTLLGAGVQSHLVMRHGSRDILGLCYPDGRMGLVLLLRDSLPVLSVAAFGTAGHASVVIPDVDDHPMFAATLQAIVEMAHSRQSPVPPAETLELLSVLIGSTFEGPGEAGLTAGVAGVSTESR